MRLFVAIELSDEVKAALAKAQAGLRADADGVRWVKPSGLHLTLKFLGEVPDRDVVKVTEAVAQATRTAEPFEMAIGGCGCFPPRGPVRIVWAGVFEASGALAPCVESLERRLEGLGFPRERRPFAPHITIGRVRDDRSAGRLRSAVEAFILDRTGQAVDEVTVMSSELSPKGATYAAISRAELASVKE